MLTGHYRYDLHGHWSTLGLEHYAWSSLHCHYCYCATGDPNVQCLLPAILLGAQLAGVPVT